MLGQAGGTIDTEPICLVLPGGVSRNPVHTEGTLLPGGMLPLNILKSRAPFPAI